MDGSSAAESPGPGLAGQSSRKARASLVLQGRYMGLRAAAQAEAEGPGQEIKEAKGVRAAIERARELAGR